MRKRFLLLSLFTAAILSVLSCSPVSIGSGPVFEAGEHCVAYRVGKRMFLVNSLTVTGKNCDIKASIEMVGTDIALKVAIPVGSFVSGEPERDSHTAEILGAPDYTEVIFLSSPIGFGNWSRAVHDGKMDVTGNLQLRGKEYPLATTLHFMQSGSGFVVTGSLETRFSDLGLNAPSVAGGLVARVNDTIQLHYQIQSDRLLKSMPNAGSNIRGFL